MGDAPPPASLIRQPLFIGLTIFCLETWGHLEPWPNIYFILVMLADALFANPERLLIEQQEHYTYLYAYASVTIEEIDLSTERRLQLDRSSVAKVRSDVLEASRICKHVSGASVLHKQRNRQTETDWAVNF